MRKCGVLMPISSLPGSYGIGGFGREAYGFVDFLAGAGQSCWQILPIGPTGYGNSPYQSFSAFSGNPYLIDLELLETRGLLSREECAAARWTGDDGTVDYAWLTSTRLAVLRTATSRMNSRDAECIAFYRENAPWLDDYALFMALKEEHGGVSWQAWPDEQRLREPQALDAAAKRLAADIEFWRAVQYLFYNQWYALKAYANEKGIKIIGDIPIYVSPDSSDIWANSELFQIDAQRRLPLAAGCPPDAFSADGQLWGNPLYDWEYHEKTGYAWWCRRLRHAGQVYDITRIDHFRGFAEYFAIPSGGRAAEGGWHKGPGAAFIDCLRRQLPDIEIIAEDLGYITRDVAALLRHSGFPGMKVLQFAFDSREASDYMPHNYESNSVVYTGTHDNTTTADWEISAPAGDVALARRYLDITPDRNFTESFIRAALASVSELAIIPMADWLGLGAAARINIPSTVGGNWIWRAVGEQFTDALQTHMNELARLYGRH